MNSRKTCSRSFRGCEKYAACIAAEGLGKDAGKDFAQRCLAEQNGKFGGITNQICHCASGVIATLSVSGEPVEMAFA